MESDPTKLTSFKPLTPVSSSNRFSFSKWIDGFTKRRTSQIPNLPPTSEQATGSSRKERKISVNNTEDKKEDLAHDREDFNSWLTKSISSQSKLFGAKEKIPETDLTPEPRKEKWRYRNVRTILRRLSALTIDRRWHQTTGDFKDDFKQYWMPDEHCKECYECGDKFNTFRRRHHCRVCGQIFCYKCCSQEVHGKIIGFSGDIRVCNYCQKIVQAYLNDDLENSIEALNEDIKAVEQGYRYDFNSSSGSLNSKSGKHMDDSGYRMKRSPSANSIASAVSERAGTPTVQRSPFDMFGVDPSEANSIKQDYLRDLWRQIIDPRTGLELQTHRFRMKLYNNCLVGNELSDWLVHYNKANTRPDAVYIGQDLLDNGWIECVYPSEPIFLDEYMLYQPSKKAMVETDKAMAEAQYLSSDDEEDSLDDHNLNMKINQQNGGSEGGSGQNNAMQTSIHEDDQEPNWLKQISSGTKTNEEDGNLGTSLSASQYRNFSAGQRLDLDLVAPENVNEPSAKRDDQMTLQMNLDSQQDNLSSEKKEIHDQNNKVSFITKAPPLPLDTYVNVEGYQNTSKKKMAKQHSSQNIITEDILKGVVFPRSSTSINSNELQVEDASEDSGRSETGEKLSHERTSLASRQHIDRLFEQLLKQENLSNSWKDILLPFIFKISEKVVPDVRRDDMDIRRYVWITKVAGGQKKDCHFISGVVFRKNVAHKRMSGSFTSPSILMLSCAIEYQRVENKMSSLDPLVLQEYAFLQNFVKRVLALKPNLILVERNVARVAQDMLLAGGVTLVHNIKPSMMENVARCTGADILQTMQQVNRPRLGKCQQFRLQKYTLPNGKSKVLMFIDGCAPDLGCSLVLRGGNEKTLVKVKKIVKYLIYVAYQLKLEAKFLADEFALPPSIDSIPNPGEKEEFNRTPLESSDIPGNEDPTQTNQDWKVTLEPTKESPPVSDNIEATKFQKVLKEIVLSSSPFCEYPLPYLLTKEGKLCASRHFIAEKIYWSRYLDGTVNNPLQLPEDDCEWVENSTVNEKVIANDPHPFTNPSLLLDCIQAGTSMETILNDFRARGGCIDLKMFHDYDRIEQQKIYGGYLMDDTSDDGMDQVDGWSKNKERTEREEDDDFLAKKQPIEQHVDTKMDCFDAFNHQKIAVLFSSYSSESKNAPKPCISPWAVFMEFYGRNDITLGGFLERYCFRPSYICPSHNCDVPMVNHVRYFAHGSGSLYIHMRNLESPIPGYDRTILTWSWCKICKQVTPVVPLSFESWAMSFAKYLELRFYGVEYKRRASVEPCNHSLHHDHYQYFSYTNMVASFKYRAIDLYEVIIPSKKVVIGKQRNPKFILNDVEELCKKVDSAMAAIRERINTLTKTEDQFNSAVREAKIKEFLTELEKEELNTKDVVHVIKKKTENFTRSVSKDTTTSSTSTESPVEISPTTLQPKLSQEPTDSLSSTSGNARSSRSSLHSQTNVDGPSDVFTTEPSPTPPPVADHQERPLTNDEIHLLWVDIARKVFHLKKNICESVEHWNHKIQDFVVQDRKREKTAYNTTVNMKTPTDITEYYPETEMGPPQPKTVTHMHPEPVSEVFLTNGTILRQTHYGTTPRDSSSPLVESSAESSPAKLRKSSSTSTVGERRELNLKLERSSSNGLPGGSGNHHTKSPYMLIKSPSYDDAKQGLSSSNTQPSANPPQPVSPMNLSDGASTEEESELFSQNRPSPRLENNRSLFHTEDSEDSDSMFASEVTSEVDTAEEEEDNSNVNNSNRSLVRQAKVDSHQPTDSALRKVKNSTTFKHKSKTSGGFSEFPKIREENIEKIEYLTPKEVKAMQVARRRRNEWESRIKAAKAEKEQPFNRPPERTERAMSITEDHFDGPGPNETSPPSTSGVSTSASSSGKQKMVKSKVNKGRKYLRNQILNRLISSNVDSSEEESDHKNRLKKVPVKTIGARKSPTPSSSFKPVKIDQDIPASEHPLCQDTAGSLSPYTPIKSATKKLNQSSPGPDFNKSVKRMGHRRMKSAPLRIKAQREGTNEKDVESGLVNEGPFVYITPVSKNQNQTEDSSIRIRSQSLGNKKQRKDQSELSRLAELVVQEDRRDVERDVPEVLQVEQMTIKSASTGEIHSRPSLESSIKSEGNSKRESTTEEDKKNAADAKKGKLGHIRHKSLTSRSIDMDATDGIKTIAVSGEGPQKGRGGSEKMKKIISNLLTNTTFNPIPRPFPSQEQYLPQVGGTASIVINEMEPTSLIAFTLSSRDYAVQLQNIQDVLSGTKGNRSNLQTPNSLASQPNSPNPLRKKPEMSSTSKGLNQLPLPLSAENDKRSWTDSTEGLLSSDGGESFMDKSNSPAPTPEPSTLKSVVGRKHPLSSVGYENESAELDLEEMAGNDDVLLEESLKTVSEEPKKKEEKGSLDHHVKLQFQNDVAKFYCSVYFAEQFRQLREKIFPEGEERFIQSLSRCKFWKATGGKSGSSFSKSYDDRFVMKQMSRLEVQSFVDFGPRYFAYINKAIKEDRPTALAKLLGVYRIGFKNSVTNATMRQDVLVMENLFYEKKVNKIFDLKGSLRGRKAQQATKEDVLLDENLLEMICDSPLFIRGHSKAILSKAIHNDTEFLSTNMVMDYSLLVGIDEARMKLVVGIIDYIRTYTWDKKLESYVKSTGILGGAGKMPTVVSPDLYRTRFTEAMQRYFLMVPDKWTGFGNDLT
ncbi:1-phosphatidylinositol 3-phosphate 5-kinase-like isoform X3 [Clytia hemisphaerica]|uniref:1-phosphatidylinositol-3-phosphate 5-kinase n=1 Tax=Clytia hemisphaerica TaxID=252671 RepID=A0A7M6DNH8_9CNID